MDSVREHRWWGEFVQRLQGESLSGLAAEYGVAEGELERALCAGGGERPVHEEPWWPEAVRRIASGQSLRDTARRFLAKPRRLRRGLARQGIRVAGENLDGDGVPMLEPFRDRLGKEPDANIAQEAGVTPQAVQGERKRLGILAYMPAPRPVLTERHRERPTPMEAEPPPSRQRPPPPTHRRREVLEPQVIRRPSSARFSDLDRRRETLADAPRKPRLLDSHEVPEGFNEGDAPPARERQGRRRIVRPDAVRQKDEEPDGVRVVRRRREPLHGEVREVVPHQVDHAELRRLFSQMTVSQALAAPAPSLSPPCVEPSPVAAPPTPAPAPVVTRPVPPAPAPVVTRPVPPAPAPVVTRPAPPARQVHLFSAEPEAALPAPPVRRGRPVTRATRPIEAGPPSRADLFAPVPSPVEVPRTLAESVRFEPERVAFAPVPAEDIGWRVSVDGVVLPLLIIAARLELAVDLLSRHLPADQLPRASIWRVGPLLS